MTGARRNYLLRYDSNVTYRSLDGSGNNFINDSFNAADTAFARIGTAHFADGISEPLDGPNPRTISNVVVGQGDPNTPNPEGLSAFMYAWGQFVDHDLDLSPSDGINHLDVAVPSGDPTLPDGSVIPL